MEPPDFVKRHLLPILLVLLALPPLILIVGSLVSQGFYDNFVFEYYWGPIAHDAGATTRSDSVYNLVNTMTYGFMALVGAIATYLIIKKGMKETGTRPDMWFFVAVTPLIVTGAVFRTLEDGEIFNRPFQYFLITPIIYGVLWAIALLFAIFTFRVLIIYKSRREGTCPIQDNKLLKLFCRIPAFVYLVLPFLVMNIFYCWVYWFREDWYLILPNPILPIIISLFYIATLFFLQRGQGKDLKFSNIYIFLSTFPMLIGLAMLIQWPNNTVWFEHFTSLKGAWAGHNLMEIPIVLLFTVFCILLIIAPCVVLGLKYTKLKVYYTGVNILLMFGHFLDASATYRALEFHPDQYSEKHVLPLFFIEKTGTAMVMFPIKILIVVGFIWLVDVYYKNDDEDITPDQRLDEEILIGLIKMMVLMVGLAPGLRDIFRLAMGI